MQLFPSVNCPKRWKSFQVRKMEYAKGVVKCIIAAWVPTHPHTDHTCTRYEEPISKAWTNKGEENGQNERKEKFAKEPAKIGK